MKNMHLLRMLRSLQNVFAILIFCFMVTACIGGGEPAADGGEDTNIGIDDGNDDSNDDTGDTDTGDTDDDDSDDQVINPGVTIISGRA